MLDPLKEAQILPLTAFAKSGGTVVLNGPPSGVKWDGAVPLVKNERHVSYRVGEGRVLELLEAIADPDEFAGDIREVLGPERRVVDVWNGITVLIALYEDATGETVMVTALNYAHDAEAVQLRVTGTFSIGYYESPESEPVLLPLRSPERPYRVRVAGPARRRAGVPHPRARTQVSPPPHQAVAERRWRCVDAIRRCVVAVVVSRAGRG